jgi:hypothetical protein
MDVFTACPAKSVPDGRPVQAREQKFNESLRDKLYACIATRNAAPTITWLAFFPAGFDDPA